MKKLLELLKSKRFLLIVLLAAIVAGYFWSQSRYPALDFKLAMGAETPIEGIAFDNLVNMPIKPTTWEKIYVNSVNWMWTNRKGMTFGIIFGAVLMCLIPFLRELQFRSSFANSALGIFVGAPLGLCVNCSTPVAHGLHESGARTETMLSAMMSSPTLNVIVLTMLFTMFPMWLGIMKVTSTLAFILIGIPLLTKFIEPDPKNVEAAKDNLNAPQMEGLFCEVIKENCGETIATESWGQAFLAVGKDFLLNLWYLIKLAVPLMILAGILGSIVISVFPLDSVIANSPDNRLMSWASMIFVALLALFLPAPMTFDVILAAVLYHSGMPVKYVAIILFTLGIFSVYPFMTIWRRISWRMAFGIAGVLILLGVANGVIANRYSIWDTVQKQKTMLKPFSKSDSKPTLNIINREQQGVPVEDLISQLKPDALRPESVFQNGNVKVNRIPFNNPPPPSAENDLLMKRHDQREFGINEHDNISVMKLDIRHALGRGIASGDVNRDGWTDFVITSDAGFALYLNKKGESFVQQRVEIPDFNDKPIMSAALVDVNNDGWLDLWFTSLRNGSYLIYSKEGKFLRENMKLMPNQPDAELVGSTAFGDLDKNGKLDVVLGNISFVAKPKAGVPYKSVRNIWLRATENGFKPEPLEGADGESLTALLSDINDDGNLDLLIGNDQQPPDVISLGDGTGGLKVVKKADNYIPVTTNFTMSIASSDLDNDLKPELFFVSISKREDPNMKLPSQRYSPQELCAEVKNEADRIRCEKFYNYRAVVGHSLSDGELWDCNRLTDQEERNACIAFNSVDEAFARKKNEKLCDTLPVGWDYVRLFCHSHFKETFTVTKEERQTFIPQKMRVNVLLKRNANNTFDDVAKPFGLDLSGWTWNAKFADLDNDGWQDLFAVNGWVRRIRTESNYFYRNLEGKGFEDITEKSGLGSLLNTVAYTYLDIDNDGDLDLIVVPIVGNLSVFINQSTANQSIAFELNDQKGNFYGIGSKIIIRYGDGKNQMREIQASGGYLSFDAPVAYFGMGQEKSVKSVEVQWSTGEKTVLENEFKTGGKYVISRLK